MNTAKKESDGKGKELELFIPGTTQMAELAKTFCSNMGLPPEAATSVLKAAQAYNNLRHTVLKQRKLPDEQRKMLVTSKTPLSQTGLQMVDELVTSTGVPYSAVSIVEGKPYIRADGLRVLLQSDPRIIKSIKCVKVRGEWHDTNYIAEFKATIEFWGGGVYEATGSADLLELQSRRERTVAPPSFVDMIAETRAKRRASREAISLPVGIAEDVEEAEKLEETHVSPKIVLETPKAPKNKAQLLAFALAHYGMMKADVEKVVNLAEVTDFEAAWDTIKAVMEPASTPAAEQKENANESGQKEVSNKQSQGTV